MTQVESIQQNIHYYKIKLNKARRVLCNDEIEKINIQCAIDFYLQELSDLKYCLQLAIKQQQ
jgi:hypothetical protein